MDNLIFYNISNINDSILDQDICKKIKFNNLQLFSKYYKEYYGKQFIDLTFIVFGRNECLGYVVCCVQDSKLWLPNDGVWIELFIDCVNKKTKIYSQIIDYLKILANQHSCNEIIIKDSLNDGMLSLLGQILFNNKYHANLTFEMLVDYKNFNKTSYRTNLRKSYKSLINWGKKNLEILVINQQNLSFDHFVTFKLFHHKISGRKTRSDESWNIQYQMIEQGFGELILGYYQQDLVAGSLFIDQKDVTVYFTGVYERELFEFGISHYLLYKGICRFYERGNTSKFYLGYFDTNIKDSKLYNIQFFKKGFCDNLFPIILWSKEINKNE